MNHVARKVAIASIVSLAAIATLAEASSSGEGDTIVSTEPADEAAAAEAPADEAPADDAAAEEAPADGGSGGSLGTLDNPAPIGSTAQIGDWQITITKVTKNANKVVAKENSFNDKPAAGQQFVMWKVDGTYTGDESGTPWVDLSWKLLGSDGNTFNDSCGVIPDSLSDVGESFSGAKVSGNVCVAADSAQLDGAKILVEESFAIDDSRTFFAIE